MTPVKEPEALVRELAEERVPPEDPGVLAARRDRVLAGIGRTIRESAVDRERRERRRRFALIGFSVAAAAALVIGISVRLHQAPKATARL